MPHQASPSKFLGVQDPCFPALIIRSATGLGPLEDQGSTQSPSQSAAGFDLVPAFTRDERLFESCTSPYIDFVCTW